MAGGGERWKREKDKEKECAVVDRGMREEMTIKGTEVGYWAERGFVFYGRVFTSIGI